MNLLQLVNRVKREAGAAGAVLLTTANQVEDMNRITTWVNSAWGDIQTLHSDWEWMRSSFSFNTVATQGSYTPIQAGVTLAGASNLANWRRNSFRKYITSLGFSNEMILPFEPYDTFRDMFLFGTMRTNYAPPVCFTIDPQKNIILGNAPDTIYTINGECYLLPTTLALDTDIPNMPAQFHEAIVWKTLAHYGMYEVAGEAVTRGQTEYDKWMARLEIDQLPKLGWGAPLA